MISPWCPPGLTVIRVSGIPKTRNAWLSIFENNWGFDSTLGIIAVIRIFNYARPCIMWFRYTSYPDDSPNNRVPWTDEILKNAVAHLLANYYIFRVLDVF